MVVYGQAGVEFYYRRPGAARHARDADRRIADHRLKGGGTLRAPLVLRWIPTIVAVAAKAEASSAMAEEQPEDHMGQLFAFPARIRTVEEGIDADRLQRPQPASPRMDEPTLEMNA
jgi:hypothetical protein